MKKLMNVFVLTLVFKGSLLGARPCEMGESPEECAARRERADSREAWLSQFGDQDIAEQADLQRKVELGKNLAHHAHGADELWMGIVIDQGAMVGSTVEEKRNVLHQAALSKKLDNLPYLLRRLGWGDLQKVINKKDGYGNVPLDYARRACRAEHVELLLKKGADLSLSSWSGDCRDVKRVLVRHRRGTWFSRGVKAVGGLAALAGGAWLARR